MRNRCLHFFVVLVLVGSVVGCGSSGGTSSVAPEEAKTKSIDAAKPGMNSSEMAPPGSNNPSSAMPSYYKDYPTGQSGHNPGGGPGGGQQPGK